MIPTIYYYGSYISFKCYKDMFFRDYERYIFTINQHYISYNTVLHCKIVLLGFHTIHYILLKYHNYPSGILAGLYLFGLTELEINNKLY